MRLDALHRPPSLLPSVPTGWSITAMPVCHWQGCWVRPATPPAREPPPNARPTCMSGKVLRRWVTGVPLAWDAAVTLTASWEKVFSSNPKLGFFAQRDKFSDAIAAGKVLPPAKNMDQMHAVVTNSTVDG